MTKNLSPKDILDATRQVIFRQVERESKSFAELAAINVTGNISHSDSDVVEVRYEGVARLTKDAAVWTENSAKIESIVDLVRFTDIPTEESLKGKIDRSRVYQIWKCGTEIPFTGAAYIYKANEGWIALGGYWYREAGMEATLNATVTGEPKPSEYLMFTVNGNLIIKSHSDKATISIPVPTEKHAEEALAAYLAEDGLQKVVSFKVTKHETDSEDSSGTYRYSSFRADVCLAFIRPAISINGEDLIPAPEVGGKAPQSVSDNGWKKCPYWETGEELNFDVSMHYRKERADPTWNRATIRSIDPVTPLKSKKTLMVRYEENDNGLTVAEISLM